MTSDRAGGLHSLVVSIQVALALTLFALVAFLFHIRGTLALERYVVYGFVVAAALVVECTKRDAPTVRIVLFEKSVLRLHPVALRQITYVLIALVLFVTLLKDPIISRIFLAVYLGALYVSLLWTSKYLPRWCAARVFGGRREHKIVLIGSSKDIPRLKPWLEHRRQLGFLTVGMLCDGEPGATVDEFRILGGSDEIERIICDQQVQQVIVLGLPLLLYRHPDVLTICNRYGVRLAILSDLDTHLRHQVIYLEDDGLHFFTMRQEPLENPRNRVFKRLLDLTIAGAVTAFVLPPVAFLVWLLHRWQSPGPLIHRQTRAGLQNQHFEIFKFRTMHVRPFAVDRQARPNDHRIFSGGRWLRKFSIDELPQFVNVLRGEMSIVGPRPHLVEHNQEFAKLLENYHIRASIRPGITGLAQVRGFRGEANPGAIEARLSADLFYLEHWSVFMELSILLRTVWHIFFPPRTAY